MKIYLVRHGEVNHNLYKKYSREGEVNHNLYKKYSREDEDLNETGIKQAEELMRKIENIQYDVIITSPLLRAKHTANIINCKNKSIIIDERLTERDPGSLSGQSLEVTNREEYWNYYSKIKYGTSENIVTFFNKVKDFLDDLKSKEYNNVLIVAHSGVSKAFYAYFNEIPENGKFLNLGLRNTELKEYEL